MLAAQIERRNTELVVTRNPEYGILASVTSYQNSIKSWFQLSTLMKLAITLNYTIEHIKSTGAHTMERPARAPPTRAPPLPPCPIHRSATHEHRHLKQFTRSAPNFKRGDSPGLGSRDGTPHAEEAAVRWRENSSSWHGGKGVSREGSGLDGRRRGRG